MAIFTAISMWATAALGAGWTIAGLSPALTTALFSAGRAIAWSMASQALARKTAPEQKVQANITQTDAPRVRAYGRVLLGGLRAFWEADDGWLSQVIVLHHGRVHGLIRFRVNGEPVTVSESGHVQESPINPDLLLNFLDGSGAGGDYPQLRSMFPTMWTVNHRLQGQATMLVRMAHPGAEQFAEVWPKGPHTIFQAEVQGSRVAVPGGGTVYTELAGPIIRDYLQHADGWRIPAARIDDASFAAFYARCIEAVPLREGGTEPRYRICGTYALDDAPKDVTERMLAACDGQIYQTPEGRAGILGGAWSDPDVTITSADILSLSDVGPGFDPFNDFNILKGSFVSPAHDYQPTEVPDRRDEAALAVQGERVEQIDIDMCPSGAQAQRLTKIIWHKRRRAQVGMMRTNLVGLKARFPKGDGIHTIRIAAPEFGLNGIYEVTSHSFSVPDRACDIGFASISNPYPWNAAAEEKPLPITAADLPKPTGTVPPPAGVTLTQVPVRVSGDTYGGKLRITVNSVTRADLSLEAQVAKGDVPADDGSPWSEDRSWKAMAGDRFSAETEILNNELAYTVRYRWRGRSAWQKAGSVTIVANPNVPAAPTGLSRVGTTGVTLKWTNPADNFWKARLFIATTNNFANATFVKDVSGLPGQESTTTHPVGAGTYHYWVVALNNSSVASLPAGPVSITL